METELIVSRTVDCLEQFAHDIHLSERDRMTALALAAARKRTVSGLRRYRAAGTTTDDCVVHQFCPIFEVTLQTTIPATLEEAETMLTSQDEALTAAMMATSQGEILASEATSALFAMVEQMKKECAYVLTTAQTM
jgi:hypothetical protein